MHVDLCHLPLQHAGHDRLNLGRILRRGVHDHLARFFGNGNRRIRFEIEVLLPADLEFTAKPMRSTRQRIARVATCDPPLRGR